MRFKVFIAAAAMVPVLLLAGCQGGSGTWFGFGGGQENRAAETNDSVAVMAEESKNAVQVKLIDVQGKPMGQAKLTNAGEGVRIELEAEHLTPRKHGFHVHEFGKCEAPDFKSAGGHFNPEGQKHGMGHPHGSHAGDLPNLEADQEGKVHFDYVAKQLTLKPNQPNSLLKDGGTSLVIHEKADDNVTEPAGNAGVRIACGEVR